MSEAAILKSSGAPYLWGSRVSVHDPMPRCLLSCTLQARPRPSSPRKPASCSLGGRATRRLKEPRIGV